jgi:predicted permease
MKQQATVPANHHSIRTPEFLADLVADLRHGLRLLRFNPGFAVVAVLSLALGIGANTAIFELLDAVRLRTLPVHQPERLAQVRVADPDWTPTVFMGNYQDLTNPLWEIIRDQQQAFSPVAAVGGQSVNLAQGGEARYAQALWVSGRFFEVMEAQPFLGHLLTADDDRPGCGSPSAVISHAFWQREFGGDPNIVGKKLTVTGKPFEIVGVTEPTFFGPEVGRSYDLALPLCSQTVAMGAGNPLERRDLWWLSVVGRLKPGWTLPQASAHLATLSPALMHETAPSDYAQREVDKYLRLKLGALPWESGFSRLRTRYEQPLWTLLAIAGAVLLIACANLANLMLARASSREREMGVRLAIGASRGRLVRQLLSESLLLAIFGAALGWLFARGFSRLLLSLLNSFGSRTSLYFLDLRLDWRMLAFTLGATVLTCVLFGLAPAVRGTSVSPASLLVSGRASTPGRGERFALRRVLVVAQVAMSFALMIGAALFSRSLDKLLNVNAGFRQDGLILVIQDFNGSHISADRMQSFRREILDRVRELPGVVGATYTVVIPVGGNYWRLALRVGNGEPRKSAFNWVSPGFFQTLEIPLLKGRDFNLHDTESSPMVAVVNEAFVRNFLPSGDPLGQTIESVAEPGAPRAIYRVVGVVKNAKYQDIREEFQPVVYAAESQHPSPFGYQFMLVRSSAPPASMIAAIKETISRANPEVGVDFDMIRNMVLRNMVRERLMATLSAIFGLLAGVLATVGLYGVVAYMVVRRTREIGIRMALGAQPPGIVRMVLKETVTLLGVGLAAGAVLAFFLVNSAAKLLYGLPPRDPASFGAAAVVLAVAVLAAGYIPARRASRLHPMTALRQE